MLNNAVILPGLLAAASQVAAAPTYNNPPTTEEPEFTPIQHIDLGPRPYWLVEDMSESPVKEKLQQCANEITEFKPTRWNIGHRGGGTLMIPEGSVESHLAGARMGSGILECDVAFTSDLELVCRHSQCDLHFTTDILLKPELAAKCSTPFQPATNGTAAKAECCTSDITVAEYKTLCATMEGFNENGTTVEEYLDGTPAWRTDLYGNCGTVMTHKENVRMLDQLGIDFVPELKTPEVEMPFKGNYTQEQFAQQLVDEYRELGIDPSRVWLQSFLYDDVLYWLEHEPEFAPNVVYLDENGETPETMPDAIAALDDYLEDGLKNIAPPLQYLVTVGGKDNKTIVPSEYALKAKELGYGIVPWTLERSGVLSDGSGGGYYFSSISDILTRDGDVYELLYVLAEEIGIVTIFTDWSSTVTFYANCFGHIW